MRIAMRVVLVVIAALTCVGALGGLGVLAFQIAGSRVVTDAQTLPAGMRTLGIDSRDAPTVVRVVTDPSADESRVEVRMVTRTGASPLVVEAGDAGARVAVDGSGSRFLGFNSGAELTIRLTPDVARELSVTVHQRAGSLSVGADLDRLVAKADNASVTLGGSAHVVDVEVGTGDISTSTGIAVTEAFRASTESGGASVQLHTAPRTTEVLATGNVTVKLPGPGPYRVRAETDMTHGATTVSVPETTDPGAPEVTAHSKNGDVQVVEIG
ncbi:hypothetical protein [Mycobacterium sp. E740]|uniref:hypothetical protein n=1 Tax=Mycobacterium sp. E740 TaxID=1834149 RepID=UPI0009ED2C64|nr:hypothetical protein [Mycobacterium sp. E740]